MRIRRSKPFINIQPGPSRSESIVFELNANNAFSMVGHDDTKLERWADIAGNYYAPEFINGFSYQHAGNDGPQVWVRINRRGPVLEGRIEVRRLKPNFAYQLKLMGDFDDRAGFERIGKLGRWRLPGQQTNYTDRDYYGFSDKAAVEAYILFDFIITDRAGNAVRNFALDSSLHVLWNAVRQSYDKEPVSPERMVRVLVDAADPWIYARPKLDVSTEEIWAEREHARYRHENSVIQLPPGNYRAVLALTEESMHSLDRDGGYWATAFTVPIKFEITPP